MTSDDGGLSELERLREDHHTAARRNSWKSIAAIVTALASAGGGSVLALSNEDDKEDLRIVFAQEIATYQAWRDVAIRDIDKLQEQNIYLRDALIKLQTTIDLLDKPRQVERNVRAHLVASEILLKQINARPMSRPMPEVDSATVQRTKASIFPDR